MTSDLDGRGQLFACAWKNSGLGVPAPLEPEVLRPVKHK